MILRVRVIGSLSLILSITGLWSLYESPKSNVAMRFSHIQYLICIGLSKPYSFLFVQ